MKPFGFEDIIPQDPGIEHWIEGIMAEPEEPGQDPEGAALEAAAIDPDIQAAAAALNRHAERLEELQAAAAGARDPEGRERFYRDVEAEAVAAALDHIRYLYLTPGIISPEGQAKHKPKMGAIHAKDGHAIALQAARPLLELLPEGRQRKAIHAILSGLHDVIYKTAAADKRKRKRMEALRQARKKGK